MLELLVELIDVKDFPFINFCHSSRLEGNFDAVINVDVVYFRRGGEEGTYSARFVLWYQTFSFSQPRRMEEGSRENKGCGRTTIGSLQSSLVSSAEISRNTKHESKRLSRYRGSYPLYCRTIYDFIESFCSLPPIKIIAFGN